MEFTKEYKNAVMTGKGINSLFRCIFQSEKGTPFWIIYNTVGQHWIFPQSHTKRFLSLFQPSSMKGKVVSKILPYLRFMPFIASKINAQAITISLHSSIEKAICKSFGITDFEYGVFCGSPGRHQKITIMINQGKKCLGYCKVTDNPEVFAIFQKESADLLYLKTKGVSCIPEILFVNEIKDLPGVFLLVQTTKREGIVRTAAINDSYIFDFVVRMHNLTKNKMSYAESDFAQSVHVLKSYIDLFKAEEKYAILHAISDVEKELSNLFYYSAYHGDFTPWNCYIVDKELFVFDFEYFQRHTIPYLDYFHFFTQSCIYNKYMEADSIFEEYLKNRELIHIKIDNVDFYYTCYLLNIMSFYLERDKGFLNERIESCFKIWIKLIRLINYEFSA